MARAKKHPNDIGIAGQLRVTAKSLIKEAFRIYGAAEGALTEAGEQFKQFGDLVSEARAEMKRAQPSRRGKRHKGKRHKGKS
jgi:ureidoglycolate hydrolase